MWSGLLLHDNEKAKEESQRVNIGNNKAIEKNNGEEEKAEGKKEAEEETTAFAGNCSFPRE
jgi:hypothetical protein